MSFRASGTFEVTLTPQPPYATDRGAGQLRVTVVPDSGTGELRGISGSMTIEIVDGRHLYTFDYAFSAAEQI